MDIIKKIPFFFVKDREDETIDQIINSLKKQEPPPKPSLLKRGKDGVKKIIKLILE